MPRNTCGNNMQTCHQIRQDLNYSGDQSISVKITLIVGITN